MKVLLSFYLQGILIVTVKDCFKFGTVVLETIAINFWTPCSFN